MTPAAVILACGARKGAQPAPAENLYDGPFFVSARGWARSVVTRDRLFVLSAKYGLVWGQDELAPYNMPLCLASPEQRQLLARLVTHQATLLGLAGSRKVWFVGAQLYVDLLRPAIPRVRRVADFLPPGRESRGIGAQRAWFADNRGRLP